MKQYSMDELIKLVQQWGKEKGINNPLMQYAKINEEVGELAHEITRGKCGIEGIPSQESVDAIGDILVTVIIFANIVGIDVTGALGLAYDTISKREGKTIDGSFIKDN